MATKVECKTCSKCLWGRTGGGDAPLSLLPLPGAATSHSQEKPGRGTGQGTEGIQVAHRPPGSHHLAFPCQQLARIRKESPECGIYKELVEEGAWGTSSQTSTTLSSEHNTASIPLRCRNRWLFLWQLSSWQVSRDHAVHGVYIVKPHHHWLREQEAAREGCMLVHS